MFGDRKLSSLPLYATASSTPTTTTTTTTTDGYGYQYTHYTANSSSNSRIDTLINMDNSSYSTAPKEASPGIMASLLARVKNSINTHDNNGNMTGNSFNSYNGKKRIDVEQELKRFSDIEFRASLHSSIRLSTHDKIVLRSIRREYLPAIKQLHEKLFPVKYNDIFYQRLFHSNISCVLAFAINEGGEEVLIGFGTGRISLEMGGSNPTESARTYRQGYVMTLGVDTDYQTLGLGSLLLYSVCRMLLQHGADSLELDVIVTNQTAINFYKKNAFMITKVNKDYYIVDNHLWDAYHLQSTGTLEKTFQKWKREREMLSRWDSGLSMADIPGGFPGMHFDHSSSSGDSSNSNQHLSNIMLC